MSILSLPRIHFFGSIEWDPNTVNNSAAMYDEANAAPVLASGVTLDTYVAWLMQSNGAPVNPQPNGSWNVFGAQAATFVDTKVSTVDLPSDMGSANDPLVGRGVQIAGLEWHDTSGVPAARLVDVDPYGFTSSQLYYEKWIVGDDQVGISGPGVQRAFSKWFNVGQRNMLGRKLFITGSWSVIWSSAIARDKIRWNGLDVSPALAELKAAVEADPANQGVCIRFVNYFTKYYAYAQWNGETITDGAQLVRAYAEGFRGANPCRSVMLGTIGVWGPGELASAPSDRLLVPTAASPTGMTRERIRVLTSKDDIPSHVAEMAAPLPAVPPKKPAWIAPASALVDRTRGVVAVDLGSTFPEIDASLEKVDLGTYVLQSRGRGPSGTVVQVGDPLTYADYCKASYERFGGIVEFPFDPALADAVEAGTLEFVQQSGDPALALRQVDLVVETDDRAVYIDEGGVESFVIRVHDKGAPSTGEVKVRIVQYDEAWSVASVSSQCVALVDAAGNPLGTDVVDVTDGQATVHVGPVQPGVSFLVFLPFTGDTPPAPPITTDNFLLQITSAYFTAVRVLPFDDDLERSTPDSQLSFQFLYENVLRTYDLVYPIMSRVRDLDDKSVVDNMADQVKMAVSSKSFLSTLYMPITRELSAGKRRLLQRYMNLLPNNVPPDPVS